MLVWFFFSKIKNYKHNSILIRKFGVWSAHRVGSVKCWDFADHGSIAENLKRNISARSSGPIRESLVKSTPKCRNVWVFSHFSRNKNNNKWSSVSVQAMGGPKPKHPSHKEKLWKSWRNFPKDYRILI